MKTRSTALWIISLVVVAALAAGTTWFVVGNDESSEKATGEPTAATTDTSAPVSEDKPSWLFSQTAGGGTFTANGDGSGTLTLTDIDPHVTAFTDRPDRDTAIIPEDKLFNAWPKIFADSPPNAVLVEHDAAGDANSFVVTLTDPVLDGTTVTFTATVVEGKDHSAQIPGLTAAPHQEPPASFGVVSLFIDDVKASATLACVTPNGAEISPPGTIPFPTTQAMDAVFEKDCKSKGGEVLLI